MSNALAAMTIRKAGMQLLAIGGFLALLACESQDWRARAIALAEDKMRADVNDPTAQFSRVQVTGDSSTGQACGFVRAATGATARVKKGRFIVYIDGTAGPYVEAGMGSQFLSQLRLAKRLPQRRLQILSAFELGPACWRYGAVSLREHVSTAEIGERYSATPFDRTEI